MCGGLSVGLLAVVLVFAGVVRAMNTDMQTESATTHTPGPWRLAVVGGFRDGQPSASIWIEAGEYYSIASVIPQREVEANAHLLAAAPELLFALKMLLADIEDYQRINHLGGADNHSQQMARAAIAKAEGR